MAMPRTASEESTRWDTPAPRVAVGHDAPGQPGRLEFVEVVGEKIGWASESVAELLGQAVAYCQRIDNGQANRLRECCMQYRTAVETVDRYRVSSNGDDLLERLVE